MRFLGLITALILFSAVQAQQAFGAEPTKVSRQKVIDFEDDLVEGMNRKPLDSLSQVGENQNRRHRPHLYRKRVGFKEETKESVREARLAQ